MRRRTHLFLVAVDEDPIPGAFDKNRITSDLERILTGAIPHYNPKTINLGSLTRDSNFLQDTSRRIFATIEDPEEVTTIYYGYELLEYKAEQPRPE